MDLIELNKISGQKEAAVMVLHDLSNDTLILTQRSKSLRSHPGEICFPGGSWQEGDENLYETALRELEEELGILSSRVQVQKTMAVERTVTGYIIHPWLASIESLSPYQADIREVSEVFSLPMSEVIKESNYQEIIVRRFGLNIKSYQYKASTHLVWGATARIMMQLVVKNQSSSA